jgi:hypothetical protein
MYKAILLFFPIGVLLFSNCKKKEEIPPNPTLEIIAVEPTSVKEFEDKVTVSIKYTDPNADLGQFNPETYTLEVKDSRILTPDLFHVKPLVYEGLEGGVEGEINLVIKNLFRIGNGATESATLTIRFQDKSGNWSNEAISPQFTITE